MSRWRFTVNGVKDAISNEDFTFAETRDRVVAALKASRWHRNNDHIADLIEEMGDTKNVNHFDAVLDAIYDEADYDRVWIA